MRRGTPRGGPSAPRTRPADEPTVTVGRVARPHGVRGEVVVRSETDVPGRFEPGSELLQAFPPDDARSGSVRPLVVDTVRPHKGALLVRFEGLDDRTAVEEIGLPGSLLEVPESSVPEAPDGTFYHFQLVGCLVEDRREGPLGSVVDVLDDGGGVLLVVERDETPGTADAAEASGPPGAPPGAPRLLVPFVGAFLAEVDIEGRRIATDLPEGLVEVCTARR